MKEGTEIKIELTEGGSWRAESLDCSGWKVEGVQNFNAAENDARDLERWSQMKICIVSGAVESVEFLGEEGRKIIETIEKAEIAAGRVEPVG